ncbi:MAG: DUF6485 family protein [Clostridia bacterium]|nr:DUF6485 family protein [Clostridia bacterium]
MIDAKTMCTCTDTKCPNHPSNHNQGCTPCIEKNLSRGEIPSCFFKATNKPKMGKAYYFEDFAKTVFGIEDKE